MKNLIGSLIILIAFLFLQKCANPGVVSGGPKDTIPPTLIYSYPVDQTLNFDDQTIILEFDERISAEKIKQNLIISPTTKTKFKHFIKKNKITIEFEEPFQDTTTYTFNFFDAITDITEKNPPINLVIAFSTGDFIDSLRVYGNVRELFTNKTVNKATVALYAKTDTMNIFEDTPNYFTTTDKYGVFKINNIKYGLYKLIVFNDENRNLNFDESDELYGFKEGTFNPGNIGDSLKINTYQIDASYLEVNAARTTGRYYEVRYSKPITNYEILHTDSILTINSNLTDDKETVRFYNPFNGFPKDSIQVVIKAIDSLKNTSVDTTYIAFQESTRKKSNFNNNSTPASGTNLSLGRSITLTFSKPVKTWDLTNFKISYDSIHSFFLDSIKIIWNHNYTKATFPSLLNQKQIVDSLTLWKSLIVIDSLNPDTLSILKKTLLDKYDINSVNLVIEPNSFLSIEDDSSAVIDLKYKFPKTEDLGTMKVNVQSDSIEYFVQLILSTKSELIQQQHNCNPCYFKNINPGKYTIKVLIDSNKDGIWSIGNIRTDTPPEPIIHYKEETEIRSNFDMTMDISIPNVDM
ncbi:MAG: Ig-like domain-containing protein [Bacteroidota bacterium]